MVTRRTRSIEPVETSPPQDWQMPVSGVPATIEQEPETEEQSPVERIAAMLSDATVDDRAYVKVARENAERGAYEFCDDYKLPVFERGGLALIRRQWGPGYYKLTLYGTRNDGKSFGILKREHVHIAALAPGAELDEPKHDPNAPPPWLPALLDRIAPVVKPVDPMDQLKQSLGLITVLREAFGMTQQQPQKSTIGEVVDAVRELRGVAGELNGQAPKEEPSLMQLGAQILELVKTHQTTAPVQPVSVPPGLAAPPVSLAAPVADSPQPEIQADTPAQPTGAKTDMGAMILMGHLNVVVRIGADPNLGDEGKRIEHAVQYIVDKVPDEAIDLIELDNWDQMLLAALPGMAQHIEWLRKVREAALKHPELQPGDDDAAGGQ